jgi:hypothetical protein
VPVVIVNRSLERVVGSHLNRIGDHDVHPHRDRRRRARQAASVYTLRAWPRRETDATSWDGSQVPDFRALRNFAVRRIDAGNFSGTACCDGRMMEEAAVQTDRSSRLSEETTR